MQTKVLTAHIPLPLANKVDKLADGLPLAAAAIDSGRARDKLEALVRLTNEKIEPAA